VSNVIDFLERLGQDAQLRTATNEEIEVALREAGVEPVGRTAILDQDRQALEALLRVEDNVCCLIYKEDEEEEEEHEDEEEEEEGEDDEEAMLEGARRVAAIA
jgi:hypothetical protein